jgi:hypothetical protein
MLARGGVCRGKVVRQLTESLGDIFKCDLLTQLLSEAKHREFRC